MKLQSHRFLAAADAPRFSWTLARMPNQGRMSLMMDKLTYDAAKKKIRILVIVKLKYRGLTYS